MTKYRYHVLVGDLALRVRELVRQTCERYEIQILRGVVSKDHVHILVSTPPDISPSAIIAYGARFAPTVRGVHFQPISYFGRFPQAPADGDRLTLPEVIELIEAQSGGAIGRDHFAPPACEHALCSFHGNFLVQENGTLLPLGNRSTCCSSGEPQAILAVEGREKSVSFTARQWSGPALPMAPPPSGCGSSEPSLPQDGLDRFLARARTHTFSLSAMAFQDVWNLDLDLERLRGCCIHIVSPQGNLIPFCAYNLTSSQGRPLYRGVRRS